MKKVLITAGLVTAITAGTFWPAVVPLIDSLVSMTIFDKPLNCTGLSRVEKVYLLSRGKECKDDSGKHQ